MNNILFIYPIYWKMLQEILALLEKVSRNKTIRLFTYGYCSLKIAEQNWLHCINGKADNEYQLYEFESSNK